MSELSDKLEVIQAREIVAYARWQIRRDEYWRKEYRWWHTLTGQSRMYHQFYGPMMPFPAYTLEQAEEILAKHGVTV